MFLLKNYAEAKTDGLVPNLILFINPNLGGRGGRG